MQTIYLTNIRSLAPSIEYYYALLGSKRKEKMMSYCFLDDRLRCLAGGLLLEQIAKGKEIQYTEYGKPFLSDGPYFNLSHSGDYVCLAVSASAPVGIDIERHCDQDFTALGKTAFHPIEYEFLMQEPGYNRFYDLWTLKESYLKMKGLSFIIEPSSFCVLQDCLVLPQGETPYIKNLNYVKGYSMALCAGEPIDVHITEIHTFP